MTSAATIIREAKTCGVLVTLSPAGTIKATGDDHAVSRWLPVIREHKAEITEALKAGAGGRSAPGLKVAIAEACTGLSITPADAMAALSPEDIEDWHAGGFGSDGLRAFAVALDLRRWMERGEKPSHYTEPATCKHCGPVWLWRRGEVMGCPWCYVLAAGRPIPRPEPVTCGDCGHFQRTNHPHLGHCAKGEPEAAAGLWDTDDRSHCAAFRASGHRIMHQTDGEALWQAIRSDPRP